MIDKIKNFNSLSFTYKLFNTEINMPEYYSSPNPKMKSLPFSEAVRVGNMLYLSGQVGSQPGTLKLVAGGIKKESAQALENIKTVLERNGSSMNQVVRCTVFLADIRDWPVFNDIYEKYFSSPFPARTAVAVASLALEARVEIDCIAYSPEEDD